MFLISLLMVTAIGGLAWYGALHGFQLVLGVALPLVGLAVFVAGFVWKVVGWAKSPVPFKIPTTAGQQRSLDWIRPARLDSPYTTTATVGRMILEVLTFRSLFRNTSTSLAMSGDEPRVLHWSSKWLWLFAILFHYSFLVIFLRHFRFFVEPVPFFVSALDSLDGMMQIGVPRFFMTDAVILAALLFLLGRRLFSARIRYISLLNDYFPLCLLIGVAGSGICMRYLDKADIAAVKELTMGLVTFNPHLPADPVSPIFFVHVTLVSVLLIYFPFSKLMHMGGVFLSPTRNMPNNSRAVHHDNPWNPPKKYRTYAEYEDDFREAMAEAGLPLEKEPDQAAG